MVGWVGMYIWVWESASLVTFFYCVDIFDDHRERLPDF